MCHGEAMNISEMTDEQFQARIDNDPFFAMIIMSGMLGKVTNVATGEVAAEKYTP